MPERICPMMTRPDKLVRCHDGYPDQDHYTFPAGLQCYLWDSGDCGLKVATVDYAKIVSDIFEHIEMLQKAEKKPDRWKEAWGELKAWCDDNSAIPKICSPMALSEMKAMMNQLEAEMGKKETLPKEELPF